MVYAGFWVRLGAFVLDTLLVTGVGALLWPLVLGGPTVVDAGAGRTTDGGWSYARVYAVEVGPGPVGASLVYWLYFFAFEASRLRATPGKIVFRLRVADAEGGRLGPGRAAVRAAARFLSGALFGIGYLMAAFTPRKQGLHDLIAGSLVLRGRPAAPAATG